MGVFLFMLTAVQSRRLSRLPCMLLMSRGVGVQNAMRQTYLFLPTSFLRLETAKVHLPRSVTDKLKLCTYTST